MGAQPTIFGAALHRHVRAQPPTFGIVSQRRPEQRISRQIEPYLRTIDLVQQLRRALIALIGEGRRSGWPRASARTAAMVTEKVYGSIP